MIILQKFVIRAAVLGTLTFLTIDAQAADWSIAGTVLTPAGIIADGAISISDTKIAAVGPAASVPGAANAVKVNGIILPGFIDLHNHLTWNVLPRWIPGRRFNNRYEWQDNPEYDRLLVAPHNAVMGAAACEAEIYAEIKALAGGATSTLGGSPKNAQHCMKGLARNLDTDSELPFQPPAAGDPCGTKLNADRTLDDVVDNGIFPLEMTHEKFDYLLCELGTGNLRGLVIHLAEGAATDSSAHREFNMLSRAKLLREGLIIIHGTALRDQDFADMHKGKVGLVWSPRSNDELYGSTTNIAAARLAQVEIAIAPDWSPSGSAGMLQEIGYAARRYGLIGPGDLIDMATATPAKIARLDDHIGSLAPNKFADFVVINTSVNPQAPQPLAPVVKANPADIMLVVVGGQPLYGDPTLLALLLPAGTKLDNMTVCGAPKAIFLGQSTAAARGQTFADLKDVLTAALAKAGSSLPEIECD